MKDITEKQYYDDDLGDVPRLSQSIANKLLNESPYHAWASHPRLGGEKKEPTEAMQLGTLLHSLVTFDSSKIVIVDAGDWRTKAAQEQRSEALEIGMIPVLRHKCEEAERAARAIRNTAREYGFNLPEMAPESTILWDEFTLTNKRVACKGRLDYWDGASLVIDLKTTSDASLQSCIRSICDRGYDLQAAAYIKAVESERPSLMGRVRFVNLFVETAAPYLMTPVEMDESFLTIGRAKWQRAVDLWHRCLTTDHWPGYVEQVVKVSAPSWAVAKEMEASATFEYGMNR